MGDWLIKKNTKKTLVSSILGASLALIVCLLFDYFNNIFSKFKHYK